MPWNPNNQPTNQQILVQIPMVYAFEKKTGALWLTTILNSL